MVFTLAPREIPENFIWRGKYFHLTYREHIPVDALLTHVRNTTSVPLVGYSIVHEDTTAYDEEGHQTHNGYEHTHAGFIFQAPLCLKGARKFDVVVSLNPHDEFDFQRIHPHVQPKVTLTQMEQLFTTYHAGRKFNIATGKTEYKEPILHVYHLPAEFDFNRAICEEVVGAPTLLDACVAGQVRPRTVSDIKALRAEAKHARQFKHKYTADTFTLQPPTDWHVLHIFGGSGLGKTKWGLAQFRNPCLVKPFDSIGCLEGLEKMFDPEVHDGLVLDEANLRFLSRQQVIALFDPDEDCTLDVRFKSFTLPAGIKKIIISNEAPSSLYPLDPHGAIARRVKTLHITAPTYGGPTPALARPPQAHVSPVTFGLAAPATPLYGTGAFGTQ